MIVAETGRPGRAWVRERVLLGWEPTPELGGILLIYFVQGVVGLARLAVSFFLKDDLGLAPAEMAALAGLAALPWMVKPLLGFITDGWPLLGYRRRPYLIVAGLVSAAAWLALATVVHQTWAALTAVMLASLGTALGDVIADSLVVERSRGVSQAQTGSLQALCWGTTAVGGVMTAYFSGWLLGHLGVRPVFAMTALFPLLVAAAAGLIRETPLPEAPAGRWLHMRQQFTLIRQALGQRAILYPSAFLFLWQATPSSESAFFFFVTNDLGFQPEFLGRVRLATSLAALGGVWLYQRFLKAIPLRHIFFGATLLSSTLGLSSLILVTHTNRQWGISDAWFSLGDSVILTVVGEIAFLPVLVLAARLCPIGIEATLFALLMSVINVAAGLSHELGALLTAGLGINEHHFDRLWLLVVITNLSSLLPLPLLSWLPATVPEAPPRPAEGPPTLQPLLLVPDPHLEPHP